MKTYTNVALFSKVWGNIWRLSDVYDEIDKITNVPFASKQCCDIGQNHCIDNFNI